MTAGSSENSVSLLRERKPWTVYSTSPAKWRTTKPSVPNRGGANLGWVPRCPVSSWMREASVAPACRHWSSRAERSETALLPAPLPSSSSSTAALSENSIRSNGRPSAAYSACTCEMADAELLKAVDGEGLHPENVEQAYLTARAAAAAATVGRQGGVDAPHEVIKEPLIRRLGEGVACTLRLGRAHPQLAQLVARNDRPSQQHRRQARLIDAPQRRALLQRLSRRRSDRRRRTRAIRATAATAAATTRRAIAAVAAIIVVLFALRRKPNVAKVQQPTDARPHLALHERRGRSQNAVERLARRRKLRAIVDAMDHDAVAANEVVKGERGVRRAVPQPEAPPQLVVGAGAQLVEGVERALALLGRDDARFF
eukprot:6507490-Prymnesium_polylepis.1